MDEGQRSGREVSPLALKKGALSCVAEVAIPNRRDQTPQGASPSDASEVGPSLRRDVPPVSSMASAVMATPLNPLVPEQAR